MIARSAASREASASSSAPGLRVSSPADGLEREADAVASRIMAMPDPAAPVHLSRRAPDQLQRCAGGCNCTEEIHRQVEEEEEEELQLSADDAGSGPVTAADVRGMGSGAPLPAATRSFFEPRFGHDLSQVRVHTDERAGALAQWVGAKAFTYHQDIAFAPGRYQPDSTAGRQLLAHELTHTIQQKHGRSGLQRLPTSPGGGGGNPMDDPRVHPAGAPKAVACAPPSHCPKHFCQPYAKESYAIHMRTKMLPVLLLGIAAAVDKRVVPLWHTHLLGGSAPQDLTKKFGNDFAKSKSTAATTTYLSGELDKKLRASPPTLADKASTTVSLAKMIPAAIKAIDNPSSVNQMNFNIPGEVAGNLAGGIGKDQLTCKAGKKPSPFNDQRLATGTALVTRTGSKLLVIPTIHYTVRDTIDLCPGDCGTKTEQLATVPISQFEATGISGDVPFTVKFSVTAKPFSVPVPKAKP